MATHVLPATPENVSVGYIDPLAASVLEIESGDEIILSTLGNWGGKVTSDLQYEDFGAVKDSFPKALGPHSLTGPVNVRGAEPGDSIVVEFLEIYPEPHGYNMVVPSPRGRGILKERFSDGRLTHFDLDRSTMTTSLGDTTVRLRPFMGCVGVAPPGSNVISTVEPGPFGGNIDLNELVVGTQLELPVFHQGAGFFCGDGHAAQGDGEINQMAIEVGMERVKIRITLKKNTGLRMPRAETDRALITLGFGTTLEEAGGVAVDSMVDELVDRYGKNPDDAYTLCSISGDLRVTQVVNGVVGMHMKFRKPESSQH
ncbi:acetamidase/formamidase family protein [Corynebacterium sp. S7]